MSLMKEDIGSMITVLGVVIAAVHIAIRSDTQTTRLQRARTIQRECEEFLRALQMGNLELVQEMEDGFLDQTKDNLEACRRYLEDPEIRASAMSTEYRDWLKISIELKTLLHYLQRFRQGLSEASTHSSSSPALGIPPYPPRHTLASRPSYTFMPNGSSDPRSTVPLASHTQPNLVRQPSQDFTSMPIPNPSSTHTNPIYQNSGHQPDASHYAPGYSPSLSRQSDPNLPTPLSAQPHLHRHQSINLPPSTPSPPIYAHQNTNPQSINTTSPAFPQSSAPVQHHASHHPSGPPPMYTQSNSSHQSVNFPSQSYPQSSPPIQYNTGSHFPQPQFTPASIYGHPNSSRQSVNGLSQSYPQTSPSLQRHSSRHSISIPQSTASGPIFAHSNSSRHSVNISPPNVPQSATVDPYQFNGDQSIYRPPHSGSQVSFYTPSDKGAAPSKGILKKPGRRHSEGAAGLESTPQTSKGAFLSRSWSTTSTAGGTTTGDSLRKNSNGEERGRRTRPPPVVSDRYGLERYSPADIFIPDFEVGATASALSHLSLDPGSRYPDFIVPQEVRRKRSSSLVRDSHSSGHGHKHEGSERKSSSKSEKKHEKKKHEKGDSRRKDKDHKR